MGTKTTTINLPWQKPAQRLQEKTMSASRKNDEHLRKKQHGKNDNDNDECQAASQKLINKKNNDQQTQDNNQPTSGNDLDTRKKNKN